MIRKHDFNILDFRIKRAIDALFSCAKKNEKNENDYILFLSRTKYDSKSPVPWRIDDAMNDLFDRDRVDFLMDYLSLNYGFRSENSQDSKYTLTIELMMYTHIWESNRNLINYKRMADLCDSKEYSPVVDVPPDGRYKWIKNNIRDIFEKHQLEIFRIIKEAYISQFRNAFAHSQYHFGHQSSELFFENKDDKHNLLSSLSFDAWTEVFLKSALIQKHFHNKYVHEARSLDPKKEYEVTLFLDGQMRKGVITYEADSDRFSGRFI